MLAKAPFPATTWALAWGALAIEATRIATRAWSSSGRSYWFAWDLQTGSTALHWGCRKGYEEVVAVLLAHGADLGAINKVRSHALTVKPAQPFKHQSFWASPIVSSVHSFAFHSVFLGMIVELCARLTVAGWQDTRRPRSIWEARWCFACYRRSQKRATQATGQNGGSRF